MRSALGITATLAATYLGLAPVAGQSTMGGVDMTLPKMTAAEMTRDEVVARLEAATADDPADFTRIWLNGLDLSALDFSDAVLRAASLNGANLANARFDGAILSQAWMIGADLKGASLVGAELFQTQLGRADLTEADFTSARAAADFTRATLTGTVFKHADFSADMRNQSMGLMRGVLKSVRGEHVDFTAAQMSRADLEFAKLPGATFVDADLSMATLGGADLSGADVSGANFEKADLTSTRLTDIIGAETANLESARNIDRALR